MTSTKKTAGSKRPSKQLPDEKERAFDERAQHLLKAIAISEDVIRKSSAFTAAQKRQLLDDLKQNRTLTANPEPAFRNLRSLANVEQAVVQPWNEEKGPDPDEFWARSTEAGLVYQRGKTLREPRPR